MSLLAAELFRGSLLRELNQLRDIRGRYAFTRQGPGNEITLLFRPVLARLELAYHSGN